MIRSMTAFASAEVSGDAGALGCEVRTVNHRYLDVSMHLPESLRAHEPALRERIKQRLARGKVDVTMQLREGQQVQALDLDAALVARLAELRNELAAHFPQLRTEFAELLRFPGVLRRRDVDADALGAQALQALDQALDALVANREREGARLAAVLDERLQGIEVQVARLRELMPQIRAAVRERLDARLADLQQEVDSGRLEQELALQLMRLDVDEEIERLAGHVSEARSVLAQDEPVGRRLDFLMQEFNREANTLGSKAADPRSTQAAVELKVLIEQMREQVQNIE